MLLVGSQIAKTFLGDDMGIYSFILKKDENSDSISILTLKILEFPTNMSTKKYSLHVICNTKKLELNVQE